MASRTRVDVYNKQQDNPYDMSVDSLLVVFTERKLPKDAYSALLTGLLRTVPRESDAPPYAASVQMVNASDRSRQFLYVNLHYGAASYDILQVYVDRINDVLLWPNSFDKIANKPYSPNKASSE